MAYLEIGLSVQVLCFHVTSTIGIRGRQDDNVCRNRFLVVESYKISDLDVLPAILLETGFPAGFVGVNDVSIESLRNRSVGIGRILCDFNSLMRIARSESIVLKSFGDVVAQVHLLARFHGWSGTWRVHWGHFHCTGFFGSYGHSRHALRVHGWSSGVCRRSALIQRFVFLRVSFFTFALLAVLPETPNIGNGSSIRFLELSPQRDLVLGCIDVFPVDKAVSRCVVKLVVENSSPPILNSIFDCCDEDNDDQRYGTQARISGAEDGENRENDDEQEVDVGDVVELEPQVLWDETEGCIFCGADLVSQNCVVG